MADFTQIQAAESLAKPAIQADLLTLLLTARVDANIVAGFQTHGTESCSICVALAYSEADFRDALVEFFNVDSRLQGSWEFGNRQGPGTLLSYRWKERVAHTGFSLEHQHGTWRDLLKAFAYSHSQLPAQS